MISSLPLRKIQGLQPAPPGDVWPFTVPSVRSILEDGLIFAPITVIVGENGAGKSVLLESVAEAFGFPLEGGSLAEQRESIEGESALGDYLQLLLDHVRAEGQVILCTHSPVLMAVRGALILEIGEWGIRPTEYEEREYKV